jgi:hypothetical protein
MDGEKQPQFGLHTTHGFLTFLTFLFLSLGGCDPESPSVIRTLL